MRKFVSQVVFPATLGIVTASVAGAEPPVQDTLNGGYYLLHKLCSDESQLPLLLTVKTTPKELEAFADKVSQTAKDSLNELERFQEHDKQIDFDRNPLPKIEQDVRDSIQGEKQHQLLFGTSGPEFARALLVSQAEASSYAVNLLKVLAKEETSPARSKALEHMAEQWHQLHEQAFALLRNY